MTPDPCGASCEPAEDATAEARSQRVTPWLDRHVYDLIGKGLLWLGKRAWRRGDVEFYDAMRYALEAGHVEGVLPKRVNR